ncbi:MAG: aspartate/glutamate racemase family protein [Burkholderiaceae bacterium]
MFASKNPARPDRAPRPALGLLMLQTVFPRPVGDVGNPASHDFPVLTRVVPGASPERVVHGAADGLLEPFVDAARALVRDGAIGIATSCGFLTPLQAELAARLPVPVAVSSLLQVPWVERCLAPGARCGVITIDAASLTPAHLRAVGAAPDTPTVGMPSDGAFHEAILGDRAALDGQASRAELLDAGRRLRERHPKVRAIVLECTNMPPYQAALQSALGCPVYDVNSLLAWFWAGLAPRHYR